MLEQVIIAGSGGQGVLLIGEIVARAGMLAGYDVTWIPEYGPATRGGTSNCTVTISDEEIGSPIADAPQCVIAMNQLSFNKFFPRIRRGGLIIINSSLVSANSERRDVTIIEIDANEIAQNLGTIQAANFVMLGAYIAHRGIVSQDAVMEAIKEWSKQHEKQAFLEVNERALLEGVRSAEEILASNPS